MQTNVVWTGREYHSMENCLVTKMENGSQINAVIVGSYDDKIYRVEYWIKTNQNWETTFAEVASQHSDKIWRFNLESDGKGHWLMNGEPAPQFNACVDIDISLTPFTNTLPINRLKLRQEDSRQIQVIYVDLLEQQIKPVNQKYSRLTPTTYRYENVPNDFEAVITVDEEGLVVDYPHLFARSARLESNYL